VANSDSDRKIKMFFDKTRKRTVNVEKKIMKDALDSLYEFSPHYMDPDSPFANGEYEINHKVSVNDGETTSHHPPIGSGQQTKGAIEEGHLKEFIEKEKDRVDVAKCGDSVSIFNTTAHADAVETGDDPVWQKEGYFPYKRTKDYLKKRYKNVLK